jgi:exosortase J
MMIVPGCNGVRGAVTLGYLALIFGYTRRLSARALTGLTLGAFLMGYVLNLTRLCTLVIYYRVGLSVTSIQRYGVEIDYVIGCTIFLLATLGIGLAVRLYEERGAKAPLDVEPLSDSQPTGLRWRTASFSLLILVFLIPQMRAIASAAHPRPAERDVIAAMPAEVGTYRLTRTWTEHDTSGHIKLVLGDYFAANAADSNRSHLILGLWVDGSNHFVANSKLYQGIRPEWSGAFDAVSESGLPVHFAGNFYNDGVNRSYDAETACTASGCKENLVLDAKTGITFSSPDLAELALARTDRRLPILLRREWTDDQPSEAVMRAQFEADARDFIAHLSLEPLLQRAGN